MGVRTGNPAWVDSATEVEAQANPDRKITAAKLNAIEAAIDDSAEASHQHDTRYVRTVNGISPDGSGDVVVSGGGSATWDTLAGKPAVIAAGATAADARTAIGAGTSSFSGDYDDLTGKPTLGTAAATASTDYATAAQGTKADAAIPSGLVDAKGDLIVATADGTVTRLPAGTDGHVLTADSGEAAGVKWAAPSGGGGPVLLATVTLSSTLFTISDIPGDYESLLMYVHTSTTLSGGRKLALTMNGDTGANYATNGNNGGQSSIPLLAAQKGASAAVFHLLRYATGDTQKVVTGTVTGSTNAGNNSVANTLTGGRWHSTSPIEALTFTFTPSDPIACTVSIYGIGEAP